MITMDVVEERLNHIVRQGDRLVELGEAQDAQLASLCTRLTILEERQSTISRLMIAMSAAIPTVILGVAKVMGIV